VTPETGYFLDKAHRLLGASEANLAINLYDVAGHLAYMAGFHAAQAFISERTGRAVKTHKGVRVELNRLNKDNPLFTRELRIFLPENYNLKTIADHETGPGAEVTPERARTALEKARRFVTTELPAWDSSPLRHRYTSRRCPISITSTIITSSCNS
jgi:uncharacterized protein (UPF0332 family)